MAFSRMVLCAVLLTLAGMASAEPLVLRFSHVTSEDTPKGQMALRFKELVENRLPGRVQVEVYPNSLLYDDDQAQEALLSGDLHLAAPSLSKFIGYTGALMVFDLPFLFGDLQAVGRFQEGPVGQALLTSMSDSGLTGLGYIHNGMKQLSAARPLRVPEDAAGLRFRVQAPGLLVSQFQAVGATGVPAPFSEVFLLLQTGLVHGQENTWSNIRTKRFHQVQPYITESNHGFLGYMVVTSTAFWSGLPEDVRDTLKQSLDEAIAHGNRLAEEEAAAALEVITAAGTSELIRLDSVQRARWQAAMRPLWAQYESRIGADVIQAALAANQ